jgi:hypothetical protein
MSDNVSFAILIEASLAHISCVIKLRHLVVITGGCSIRARNGASRDDPGVPFTKHTQPQLKDAFLSSPK